MVSVKGRKMSNFGMSNYNHNNIYGYGNFRLSVHYYRHILKDLSSGKSILDIGCGDGVVGTIVEDDVVYKGLDIGAGCYDEIERDDIHYIRDYDQLLSSIENQKSDISLLLNVLEHTFDFTELFEKALLNSNEYVFVALPNEENIHLRLDFLLGKGITSHTLDMVGLHVNRRHLWLIQEKKAEEILVKVAKKHNFVLESKHRTISYPSTMWKRVVYKGLTSFLPWSLKSRNFGFLFKKTH